jgi:predicted enzyme related to lactoylglutathione lyase
MLEGVAVVWMPVEDIGRAKGFYGDTLGLTITNEDGDWAEVDANGLTIGLNGREPSGAGVEGGPVVTFQPGAGLDKTIDYLKDQGVDVPAGISAPLGPRGDLGGDPKLLNQRRSTSVLSCLRARLRSCCWGGTSR